MNALVTGLILFKIIKVYLEVKPSLGIIAGSKLRPVIFMLIESGMAMFTIQLARLVLDIMRTDAVKVDEPIAFVYQMINVSIDQPLYFLFY